MKRNIEHVDKDTRENNQPPLKKLKKSNTPSIEIDKDKCYEIVKSLFESGESFQAKQVAQNLLEAVYDCTENSQTGYKQFESISETLISNLEEVHNETTKVKSEMLIKKAQNFITYIPDEIIIEIGSYIADWTLLNKTFRLRENYKHFAPMMAVCKNWNNALKHRVFSNQGLIYTFDTKSTLSSLDDVSEDKMLTIMKIEHSTVKRKNIFKFPKSSRSSPLELKEIKLLKINGLYHNEFSIFAERYDFTAMSEIKIGAIQVVVNCWFTPNQDQMLDFLKMIMKPLPLRHNPQILIQIEIHTTVICLFGSTTVRGLKKMVKMVSECPIDALARKLYTDDENESITPKAHETALFFHVSKKSKSIKWRNDLIDKRAAPINSN